MTAGLIPAPAKLTARDGTFTLTPSTHIQTSAGLHALGELARQYLRPATGLPLKVVESATHSRIVLSLDPRLGHFGDEGYRLTVAKDEVLIRSLTLHQIQTQFICNEIIRTGTPQTNDRSLSPMAVAFAQQQGLIDAYVMHKLL